MTAVNQAPKLITSEHDWQNLVLDALRLHRWRFVHFTPAPTTRGLWRTPFDGHAGFPDVCALKGGRLLIAELKVGRAVPTPDQRAWLDLFTAAGAAVHVWYPENWQDVYATVAAPDRVEVGA
jgi:hypothetical protein